MLDPTMMRLEDGTTRPLLGLGLLTTRCIVVGIGRAQELLDEVLPATTLRERPLAQKSLVRVAATSGNRVGCTTVGRGGQVILTTAGMLSGSMSSTLS